MHVLPVTPWVSSVFQFLQEITCLVTEGQLVSVSNEYGISNVKGKGMRKRDLCGSV